MVNELNFFSNSLINKFNLYFAMSDQEGDLLVSVKSKRRSDKKGKNVPLNELGFKPKVYYDCVDGRPKKIFHRFRKYITPI